MASPTTTESTALLPQDLNHMQKTAKHEVQGTTRCGIEAFSNHANDVFSVSNDVEGMRTGVKWQCVEFARRYCLLRKGVYLPEIYFAAHLIYLNEVFHVESGQNVPAVPVLNGGKEKPEADAIVIYGSKIGSLPGHVGVIVEVGDDFVRIADQNRFFHPWGDATYSSQFPLRYDERKGTWTIVDKEEICVGWVKFPTAPLRPVGAPLPRREGLVDPPSMGGTPFHLRLFARGWWDQVPVLHKFPYAILFSVLVVTFTAARGVQSLKRRISGKKLTETEGKQAEKTTTTKG